MNELQTFNHPMFGELPVLMIQHNPFFPATDVAKILGYANPHKAITDHCRPEGVNETLVPTVGGHQMKKFISEGNLYRLITRSKLPDAERFEKWIFDDILPSIRKTGGYIGNDDIFVSTYLPFADDQTKLLFRATLETVRKQNELIGIMQPKANYFDALVERNLLTNFRDTAKELQVKEREFINWLIAQKFVYRDQKDKLKPYAQYVPDLFEIKDFERNGKAGTQTLITPKGKETFRLLMEKKVS
jgi:prophage antirepressor-like protein